MADFIAYTFLSIVAWLAIVATIERQSGRELSWRAWWLLLTIGALCGAAIGGLGYVVG